ncbi:phage tail protein I [Methylobacterium iners]|uniref:Phage tail protein I n=1 Tax=Methylobacterium iners TaxID=418707 RepID=A0ABQ4RRK5_9HYPH|nr:phage tail protein I [Methylobacterium iners]GJD93354.1 hypothetical protein OCOJLMKI_0547 [Methylobacterium iners]
MSELVYPDRDFVLPGDATPLELAIADTEGRLDDIDMDEIRRVRSVADAPAVYLKHQAWERSVDVWDPLWPEDIKRAVIEAAPIVHSYKGTRYAVRIALAALKADTVITEWWEESPRGVPYTFAVKAYARARLYEGPVLDDRLIRVMFTSIMRAKPASRAFGFTVGATFPRSLGLAPVAAGKVASRRALHPSLDAKSGRTLGLAPIALGTVTPRVALHPTLDARSGRTLGLTSVALGRTRVRAPILLRSAP